MPSYLSCTKVHQAPHLSLPVSRVQVEMDAILARLGIRHALEAEAGPVPVRVMEEDELAKVLVDLVAERRAPELGHALDVNTVHRHTCHSQHYPALPRTSASLP